MEETNETQTFEQYVELSLKSGVSPLELAFVPVTDCETGKCVAFRTRTVIRSVIAGTLQPEDYVHICDKRDTGAELFIQSLRHAVAFLKRFGDALPIRFLAVRCPAEAVENPGFDLYGAISQVMKESRFTHSSAICVEFPADLLETDSEKAKRVLADVASLKVKTLITGCGREDFPLSKLVSVQPYAVLLDKTAAAWAGSRDKPRLVPALIAYINSMGIEAYAEGTHEVRSELRRTDCAGVTDCNAVPLTAEQAFKIATAESEYEV